MVSNLLFEPLEKNLALEYILKKNKPRHFIKGYFPRRHLHKAPLSVHPCVQLKFNIERNDMRPWGRGLLQCQVFELAAWKTCHSELQGTKREPPAHKIPEPTTIWLLLGLMIKESTFPWVNVAGLDWVKLGYINCPKKTRFNNNWASAWFYNQEIFIPMG